MLLGFFFCAFPSSFAPKCTKIRGKSVILQDFYRKQLKIAPKRKR